jgi:hypothetical protein
MSNAKNYFAHGGNELVIGGKLTFLPGAIVEGGEGLFDLPAEARSRRCLFWMTVRRPP